MGYCEHCARRQHPDYRLRWQDFGRLTKDGRMLVWSVPIAQALIRLRAAYQLPVATRTLTPDELIHVVQVNEVNPEHVAHLPATATEEPGIAVLIPVDDRQAEMFVIDGSHRAARCLAEGRSFRVQVLDPVDSEIALIQEDGKIHYQG